MKSRAIDHPPGGRVDGSRRGVLVHLSVESDFRALEELADWAAGLGVASSLVELGLLCARNPGSGLQVHFGDSKAAVRLLQGRRRGGADIVRGEARLAQLRTESHREAGGMGGSQKLLRIRPRLIAKAL